MPLPGGLLVPEGILQLSSQYFGAGTTIDFPLNSVTSSYVQIWKIATKIVVGVKVLYNQETTKAIRFIYDLSIF
jgi:hypothetical protein